MHRLLRRDGNIRITRAAVVAAKNAGSTVNIVNTRSIRKVGSIRSTRSDRQKIVIGIEATAIEIVIVIGIEREIITWMTSRTTMIRVIQRREVQADDTRTMVLWIMGTMDRPPLPRSDIVSENGIEAAIAAVTVVETVMETGVGGVAEIVVGMMAGIVIGGVASTTMAKEKGV
jgi:hypothetical protein